MTNTPDITIPQSMRPGDGRFGSGPSKVRSEAVAALAQEADGYLGTSHRRDGVRFVVAALRNGLLEMFDAPDGYEILLGNGGATLFWDAASFGLIDRASQHLVCGEFSSKFAAVTAKAPHIGDPQVIESDPGTAPALVPSREVDAYCYPHNETSTGVVLPVVRPEGVSGDEGLVMVDATSGAGGLRFDATNADVYYFAPQKCFSSDGGLWIALCSPAAIERIEAIAAGDRWQPAGLDLKLALDNSRKDQTYNTPALATIFLALQYTEWVNGNGGLDWAAGRSDKSAETLYGWAESRDWASPFVSDTELRSPVVGTIDIDDRIDALEISGVLRQNGIIDTESYRKLGRNQLRIAMFPGIEPDDIEALTHCIDHVVDALT